MRSLLSLMEEWAPKGVDLPALRKFKTLDLNDPSDVDEVSQLRVKNMKLEEEVSKNLFRLGDLRQAVGKCFQVMLLEVTHLRSGRAG